ncbi:MAG: xanthine dehydrogenase family protein molybdopterin-binding subunit [Reyranella sp.]|uniref:xanthine dehydrogenase family protein molybdopterin-binding subunit n=1 Tax=Reyranella sp. TaxID=1929291 RepID=UPI00122550B4|nr:molybdopterin cofactor-binding domain-containing protein [Reyranella sp.]TAJ37330.1 MAG: xanthine dehydrogenase family protein molybdopterin-binding subunit [Reyranella sp.]
MTASVLPASLIENPRLDRWIKFQADRTVRIATGKVEMGQGIVTAIGQIAAEELDVPLGRVAVLSGDTTHGPDELYTTSSLSVDVSGGSVRLVCAEVRAKALERAALRLNCSRDELTVVDGRFLQNGAPTGQDYWTVAAEIDLTQAVTGTAPPKPVASYKVVGQSVPRVDLPGKMSGAAFVHDVLPADVLHARTLRQPNRGAVLASLDEAAIRRAAKGELQIVRDANFVAFVSPVEAVAQAAAVAAPRHAKWNGVRRIEPEQQEAAWLKGRPSDDRHIGAPPPATPPRNLVQATFSRPYISHGSMAPSCALAEYRDGHLTIRSHGQGMHPLRQNLAAALGLPIESITCQHLHGAGCYGHNGADDAALDAALIALRLPGKCIRLQWRREEEFGFEPVGPAMLVTLHVDLDARGRPADWTTEIWSPTHVQRPGTGTGFLLASEALANPPPEVAPFDPTEQRGGGGTRNAAPIYDVPAHRIVHHLVMRPPVRTSALRGLGALPNVYAIESLIDDLAARLGEDPVAYRLSILSEPRARRLVEAVAERAGWASRGTGGAGKGLGLGFARYKNRAAYAAVVAAVTVEETVRVDRVWCVADAGLVVNPDGARNQLEGGIVQAVSWTLKEQVRFDGEGIASRDWDSYPILRFSEIPEMRVEFVEASGNPALGVGECTVGPTAAAIGNAVHHALGVRLRDMPLTRERILAALA